MVSLPPSCLLAFVLSILINDMLGWVGKTNLIIHCYQYIFQFLYWWSWCCINPFVSFWFFTFTFCPSQPYYWRLAGVEKEKSPVNVFPPKLSFNAFFPWYLHDTSEIVFRRNTWVGFTNSWMYLYIGSNVCKYKDEQSRAEAFRIISSGSKDLRGIFQLIYSGQGKRKMPFILHLSKLCIWIRLAKIHSRPYCI